MGAVATLLEVVDLREDLIDDPKGDETWKPFTTRDVVLEKNIQAVMKRMIKASTITTNASRIFISQRSIFYSIREKGMHP
jgi:hypothetical protein